MRANQCLAAIIIVTCVACGSSPTAPSASATPQPTTFALSGQVASTTGAGIAGATVAIADGSNAGRSTTTDGAGNYAFASLTAGGFTANYSAKNYFSTSKGIGLTSNQTVNVQLQPTPLFAASGSGNTVFDMPTTVSRIHITADFRGYCQNFIVHIGGRGVVNEILGACPVATTGTHYDAIALTIGGVVEIVDSSGVAWSFTEVR